jgi:antitoxin component YwqK of YwqJK toxin-antitoxin module
MAGSTLFTIFRKAGFFLAPETRVDENGDGLAERLIFYNTEGLPEKSCHDLDRDGKMETFRTYQKGEVVTQKKDQDHDGRFEIVTRFKDNEPFEQLKDSNRDGDKKPIYQEKDTNFDGKKDFFCHFDTKGFPEKIEEDTRHTGRIDRIRIYRKGEPVKVEYDADGDGFMEIISFYKEGKMSLQTHDENKNGKPDVKIFFNQKEEKERVEKDEEGNGKVDLKVFYKNGGKVKLIKDNDHDGRFETTQRDLKT